MLSDDGIYKQRTAASVAQLTGVHLAAEEVSLTWPLAKSPDTDTPYSAAPHNTHSSHLLTNPEEMIHEVTTMDISEIMLTQNRGHHQIL